MVKWSVPSKVLMTTTDEHCTISKDYESSDNRRRVMATLYTVDASVCCASEGNHCMVQALPILANRNCC